MNRRTKIIATIGPATDNDETIEQLILAGVNVARLNMSHATHEQATGSVERIRRISKKLNRHIGILMDTQGPAIRTGNLETDLNLTPGDVVALTVCGEVSEEYKSIDVNYDDLVNDIGVDDVVIVDNGNIQLKVLKKHNKILDCEVLTEGVLGSRRHINLPGIRVNLPALTEKDIKDIELGIELDVDIIAMSFVREAKDVLKLRGILDYKNGKQKIIAKLEDQQGYSNLQEIIDVSDGIMVARGDLGIELPFEELPIVQRNIVKQCTLSGTTVIVATHMLESMIENPAPTRAEVTDVANAVYEQPDAIMLSGETSVGKYPIRCVEVMDKIARRTEQSGGVGFFEEAIRDTAGALMTKAGSQLSKEIGAKALVVFTRFGLMARNAAWCRPLHTPIYAFTKQSRTARQLQLCWGIETLDFTYNEDANENIKFAAQKILDMGLADSGDSIVVVTELLVRGKTIDTIQVEEL